MQNAGLDDSQAGIKSVRRNINNLRYAVSNGRKWRRTKELLDEGKKGEWKSWLKLNIQKTKIMASGSITSWQIDGEKVETVTDFIFLGSIITAHDDCSHKIKRHLLLERQTMTNISSVQSCMTLCKLMDCACQASLSFTISQSLLKLMSFELVMPSNHLILCCPLLLPSIFPSITVFSIELTLCIRWSKYWSLFSASALPMNIQGWFPLILTGSNSLQSKGLSRVFSSTTFQKHQFFTAQPSFWSNSHIHIWLLEKQVAFTLTYGISNLSSHIVCYI